MGTTQQIFPFFFECSHHEESQNRQIKRVKNIIELSSDIGKSLLLSRFLKDSKAFALGPTLEGCTKGIWISTNAIVSKETGHYNFLLDCEGAGDPLEGDEAGNARIALVCILIE